MPNFKIRQRENDFQNNRTAYPASETNKLDNSYDDEFDRFLNSERDQTELPEEYCEFVASIVNAMTVSSQARRNLLFFKDSFEESENNIHETMDLILIDHLTKLLERRKESIKKARSLSSRDKFTAKTKFDELEDLFLNSDPLGEVRVVFPSSSISDDHDELTGFY